MQNYYFVKISCPDSSDDNVFFKMVSKSISQESFTATLENIPWKLSEANIEDFVFLQLGGDTGKKRSYFSQNPHLANFENAWYAVGTITGIEKDNKEITINFYPFKSPVSKIDLYLYPQFIDSLGCSSKGIPNQAGLYDLDKETALSFIEYLFLNDNLGESEAILKALPFNGSLQESAELFYSKNTNILSSKSSTLIKNILSNSTTSTLNHPIIPSNFDLTKFIDSLFDTHLILATELPYKFTSALQTKPFVILTGLSGSGKTKLAEAFSLWITENKAQTCMVAVGADWTNREPLLGFPNALEKGHYVKPESGVLDVILNASNDPQRPYFLILDEMNMSHVERYFADFLSAMESSSGEIALHPDTDDWAACDVPATICLPSNLFIIGTVNIDETTYMFSPKVLDRANVIEFRVSGVDMQGYFDAPSELNLESLTGAGASMATSFVAKANEKGLMAENLADALMPFFDQLSEVGAEFGYRTASEMSRFVKICGELAGSKMTDDKVIDSAIIQKLLPKLHGSRNKIEKVLTTLGGLCLADANKSTAPFNTDISDDDIKYPLSYEKLKRMHQRVLSDGFTSFAEA